MTEAITTNCPYCGEPVELNVDAGGGRRSALLTSSAVCRFPSSSRPDSTGMRVGPPPCGRARVDITPIRRQCPRLHRRRTVLIPLIRAKISVEFYEERPPSVSNCPSQSTSGSSKPHLGCLRRRLGTSSSPQRPKPDSSWASRTSRPKARGHASTLPKASTSSAFENRRH